jgi:multicomponent K+:H+ antiporter subunit E
MNPIRRLVPFPGSSLMLALFWLLLVNRFEPLHVALAAALGLLVPPLTAGLRPACRRLRRLDAALALAAVFFYDMLVANVVVAGLVLGPRRRLVPAFIEVPVDLNDSAAVALLAGIVTLTPGTVSVEVSAQRATLLVHALRAPDAADVAARIKRRYEARIKEVFAC